MPSFEENQNETLPDPALRYEPGQSSQEKQADTTKPSQSKEEAPAQPKAEPVSESKNSSGIPEELKPANLDASLPLPKPAALQRPQKTPASSNKRRGMRARSGAAESEKAKDMGMGEVGDLVEVKENLSGRRAKGDSSAKSRPRKPRSEKEDKPTEGTAAKASEPKENGDRPPAKKRARKRTNNRKRNEEGKEGEKSKPQNRNEENRKRNSNNRPPRKAQEDDLGFIGQLIKFIKSLFGAEEKKPTPMRNNSRGGQNRGRRGGQGNRNNRGRNNNRGNNRNRPNNQRKEGEEGNSERKPRRRRRPNNRRKGPPRESSSNNETQAS